MLHSTISSTTVTNLRYAAAPPPPQVPTRTHSLRPSFHLEFAAHQLLRRIADLQDNWDGYGALPIQHNTALNAHLALNTLLLDAPVPDITPNTNGTVSFEWETQFG